jgi:hypothetical protein
LERLTGTKLPAGRPLLAGADVGANAVAGDPKPAPRPDAASVETVLARVVDVARGGAGVIERIDGAYAERTLLILTLCSLFPCGLKRAPVPGMPKQFETAVYIDTPAGQASWHLHEDDLPAFAHLPDYRGGWDGHSTAEKYRRLTSPAFAATEERKALAFYANGFEYAGQDDNVSAEPTVALCEDAGRLAAEALKHRFGHRADGLEHALAELGTDADEPAAGPVGP